jgi:hypothetical protein
MSKENLFGILNGIFLGLFLEEGARGLWEHEMSPRIASFGVLLVIVTLACSSSWGDKH